MDSNDGAAAAVRDQWRRSWSSTPANQEALDMKRGRGEPPPRRAAASAPERQSRRLKSRPRDFREGPAKRGRTTRPARQRIQVNFQEGSRSLERQDFPLAIVRFQ